MLHTKFQRGSATSCSLAVDAKSSKAIHLGTRLDKMTTYISIQEVGVLRRCVCRFDTITVNIWVKAILEHEGSS